MISLSGKRHKASIHFMINLIGIYVNLKIVKLKYTYTFYIGDMLLFTRNNKN